ncbi:MAG: response regulator [Saprospiraceae bacterium]|nr:response regulator [Lewinella sp.]
MKIILVEDSISDVKLTQYALDQLTPAPELLHFYAGEDLFLFLDQSSQNNFSLILLDLNLPKMSGLEILQGLRRRHDMSRLPVVIFSSSKKETDVLSCYENGANAYVQKPLTLDDFDRAMEAIVNFWSHANLAPNLVRA